MTKLPLVVWSEIPVRDVAAAARFYDAVLGTKTPVENEGTRVVANLGGGLDTVGCTLHEGAPGAGSLVHFNIDNLDDASARLESAGGKVVSPPVEIPPGRFVFATDPDGNKLGLFEAKR
jgi:hypothetical protein